MTIKESKNLKHTKFPFYYFFEVIEKADPKKCLLDSFHDVDDKVELHFQNGTIAFVAALNFQGGFEMDQIKAKLKSFIGKSYEDILNAEII